MKTPSARVIAAQIISRVLTDQAFAKEALDSALSQSQLDPRDKGFCTELVYGTLRWALQLEGSLKRALNKPGSKIDKKLLPHLLVAAYQLQHLSDSIPAYAAVNGCVETIKKQRPGLQGFVNAILRQLGSPPHLTLPDNSTDLPAIATAYGLPLWIAEKIASQLPKEECLPAIASFNSRPHLYLRSFSPPLAKGAGGFFRHPFVPDAVHLEDFNTSFQQATQIVQDPASQVAALLCTPQPGQLAIDLCAAPGGKTMILAHAVGLSGKVIANDISVTKAARIKENANRLGLTNVEIQTHDARQFSSNGDVVLLDAPCSGLGTLRRHPEIKLRRTTDDLSDLINLQRELLNAAASLVKPGGTLVYSVCSPLAEEGSAQVDSFLSNHPNFKREPANTILPWLPKNAVNALGEITLWPHRHDADAFFAVRLRRAD